MARFNRAGVNWEGRAWHVPPSLAALIDEVEAWQPDSRGSDGTVASKAHDEANPTSDHRPTPYTGPGIVRAVDVGEIDPEGNVLTEALRLSKDKRIKYVIHEDQMFSSYSTTVRKAWEWGKYTGPNPHSGHAHISTLSQYDATGGPWNLGLPGAEQPGEDMPFLPLTYGHGYDKPPTDSGLTGSQLAKRQDVYYLQYLLVDAGAVLVPDGVYGPATIAAVALKGGGDGKVVLGGTLRTIERRADEHTHGDGGDHNHDGRYLKSVEGKL